MARFRIGYEVDPPEKPELVASRKIQLFRGDIQLGTDAVIGRDDPLASFGEHDLDDGTALEFRHADLGAAGQSSPVHVVTATATARKHPPAQPSAQPVVIDDGGDGYSQDGAWTTAPKGGLSAYGETYRFAAPGDGDTEATWTFPGMPSGDVEVLASWSPYENRATNAPYRIYEGENLLKEVRADQRTPPGGATINDSPFQVLATVTTKGGSLRIVLANDADNYVIADAVAVRPVGGGAPETTPPPEPRDGRPLIEEV